MAMKDSVNKLAELTDLEMAKERCIRSKPVPDTCGFCSAKLADQPYYIDGAVRGSGAWANMCPECYFKYGAGIEWGKGQLYAREDGGSWLLVAGFGPSEGDPICAFCGEEFDKEDLIKVGDDAYMCKPCIEEGSAAIRAMMAARNARTDGHKGD